MVLDKTKLLHCYSDAIGGSYCRLVSCGSVELMFFLVWFMCPLDVTMDGGICHVIRLIVMFGHVANYNLLIEWTRI